MHTVLLHYEQHANTGTHTHTPLRGLALAAESECDLAKELWVDQVDPPSLAEMQLYADRNK